MTTKVFDNHGKQRFQLMHSHWIMLLNARMSVTVLLLRISMIMESGDFVNAVSLVNMNMSESQAKRDGVTVKTIKDHEETESLLMISRWYAFQIGRKRMMVLPQRYWRMIEKREPFWMVSISNR